MSGVPARYWVEPLGDSHDRTGFHCGIVELDTYFRDQIGQDARRKIAAPFVMLAPGGTIVGYYTLSAYGVLIGELPDAVAKRLPRYPLLPATLLARLAVHAEHRGRKLGRLLLMDALHRSWKNTSEIASIGVVAEAIDDPARTFYRHHEFQPLVEHPNKLFSSMATIEKALRVID
jgi:GNAT superfamily N-acetyltransferase